MQSGAGLAGAQPEYIEPHNFRGGFMHLDLFRVTNFRSIQDSGEVLVSQITALLGRNESGKSNLLRALASLNPADGFEALDPSKNFPKHRRLSECTSKTPVISSRWSLGDN